MNIKYIVVPLAVALVLSVNPGAHAATITAASCTSADVQAAIDQAVEGSTVLVPVGNCSWASSVTIRGKGIVVAGAGSGRIIAYSVTTNAVPIANGTLSLSVI